MASIATVARILYYTLIMTGEIMAYTFAHLMLLDLQAAASRISCPFSFTVNYCLDAGNSGNKVGGGGPIRRGSIGQ